MQRKLFQKDKQAVSPVIATILMVAITVVLAATLYMMIDTGDDVGTLLVGGLSYSSGGSQLNAYEPVGADSYQAHARLSISLDTPRNSEIEKIIVTVLDSEGNELEEDEFEAEFTLLDEGRVSTGSRLTVTVYIEEDNGEPAVSSIRRYEVFVRISGYQGTLGEKLG